MTNADFDGSAGDTFDECIKIHWGLVIKVVRAAEEKYPDIAGYRDEYEQEMRIKLWEAWRGFDPSRGWRFSTYAYKALARNMWRAKANIIDARSGRPTKNPQKVKISECASLDAPIGQSDRTARNLVEDQRDHERERREDEARWILAVAIDAADCKEAERDALAVKRWIDYKNNKMTRAKYRRCCLQANQRDLEQMAERLIESAAHAGLLSNTEFAEID